MSNDEKKLEEYVDSIRFDDEPTAAGRDKLEKQLLEAYDNQQEVGGYVEPVSVYFRKLAVAAGFLVAAGVLFWAIDSAFIGPDKNHFAGHPEEETIQKIIEEENVSGSEKKKLIAQISDVWDMVTNKDTDGLVAVLETQDTAYAVRSWAAKYLGKFGNEKALSGLQATIEKLNISDPNNPLVMAADKIRQRLGLPEEEKIAPKENYGIQSLESVEEKK